MLCNKCRQREATVHKTTYVADGGVTEEPTIINLCAECHQEEDPGIVAMIQAGCHYCDGEFSCTATDPSDMAAQQPKQFGLCARCADEFHGYVRRIVPGFGVSMPTDEE